MSHGRLNICFADDDADVTLLLLEVVLLLLNLRSSILVEAVGGIVLTAGYSVVLSRPTIMQIELFAFQEFCRVSY